MQATNRALLTFALALAVGVALPHGAGFAANSGGGSSNSGGSSSGSSSSSSSSSSANSITAMYSQASAKVDAQDYRGAMPILDKIIAKDPHNPDALNLMGFCDRKLGNTDEALEYYNKALAIRPNHVGANEYLGELYLELKNLPKAEERLKVLAKACNGCQEQQELKEKIDKYKAANNS
jgi:tetratricopeptide (TPR) repeat protein